MSTSDRLCLGGIFSFHAGGGELRNRVVGKSGGIRRPSNGTMLLIWAI
ncbi:MAG: hypothetical protein LBH90_09495 [Tannerella sp.]|nr:hypothetical protein [Tannerella sp.]